MRAAAKSKSAGFTLTELMIAVAVLGILVSMGMPSFRQMLRSAEIRSVAESVSNGLQRARAEAVARNTRVRFVLTVTGGAYTTAWNVLDAAGTTVDSRRSDDGSSPNTTLTAVASDGTTAATTITYNQLGQVVVNADGSAILARVDIAATGSVRNLRVAIGTGGNARVCDPKMVTGSNPRAC
jgi:type IV fimbrial biogenesis protein FimT